MLKFTKKCMACRTAFTDSYLVFPGMKSGNGLLGDNVLSGIASSSVSLGCRVAVSLGYRAAIYSLG